MRFALVMPDITTILRAKGQREKDASCHEQKIKTVTKLAFFHSINKFSARFFHMKSVTRLSNPGREPCQFAECRDARPVRPLAFVVDS